MQQEVAFSHALKAITFILADDVLRDRFLALSGLSPEEIRASIQRPDFLASVLEFLIGHEPDLLAFAEATEEKPTNIVAAWRQLGGGEGQEW